MKKLCAGDPREGNQRGFPYVALEASNCQGVACGSMLWPPRYGAAHIHRPALSASNRGPLLPRYKQAKGSLGSVHSRPPPSGAFLIRASAGGVRGLGLGRPSDAPWFPAFIVER